MTVRQPQDLNRKLERGYSVSPSVDKCDRLTANPSPACPSDDQARHCKSPCPLLYA